MSTIKETLAPVLGGGEVVLTEPYRAFLAGTALPYLLVVVGGGILGVMQGGLWWAVPGVGAVIFVLVVIWGVLRRKPQMMIGPSELTADAQSFPWSEIESFGGGNAEYATPWVFITRQDGEIHELQSTYGWKNTDLRDALNDLLRDLNPESSRAQFEAVQEESAESVQEDTVDLRFRRPTGPVDALEQARQLLGSYYHADCDTVTEVNERVIRIAAMDPHYFPLSETDCVGCGSAPMNEVMLVNGQSLLEAFQEMQKAVPLKAVLGKFFLFSAVLSPIGAAVGFMIPVAKNGEILAMLGAGGGLLLGIILSLLLYRPLRRAGWMW